MALRAWTHRLLDIYQEHGPMISKHYGGSWVRIWLTFVVPDWINHTEDFFPDGDLPEIFYKVSLEEEDEDGIPPLVFDSYQGILDPVLTWESILKNSFVQSHLDLSKRMMEGQTRPEDRRSRMEDVIHFSSFLTVDGLPSWTFREALPYREASSATWSAMRAIRSLAILSTDPEEALSMTHLSTMEEYLRHILIPFIGASMAWHCYETTSSLVEFDLHYTRAYRVPTMPKPSWNPLSSQAYLRWCEEDRRQQWEKLGINRGGVTNSLNCSNPPSPSTLSEACPPDETLHRRQRPKVHSPSSSTSPVGGRGGGGRGRGGGRGPPPEKSMPNYSKGSPIPPPEVLKKIPMIMRRRDGRPSVEGTTPCFLQDDTTQSILQELPVLLQNPRLRDAYMQSVFPVFERPIRDMPVFYREQLCEVITSLCLELSTKATTQEEGHVIVQKYHGMQRDDESLEQYYFNFRSNAWSAISDLYQSLKSTLAPPL